MLPYGLGTFFGVRIFFLQHPTEGRSEIYLWEKFSRQRFTKLVEPCRKQFSQCDKSPVSALLRDKTSL